MNTDKHTCVCATCGQGFTRMSSALRLNGSLHSGQAMIVRPYEYIIGRLKGEFAPSDPAIYRRKRNRIYSLAYNYSSQTKNNEGTDSKIHADLLVHESHPPPSSIYPMSQGKALYHDSETSRWPVTQETPYTSNQLTRRELLLKELEVLMYKVFPPQFAAQLLTQNSSLSNTTENNAYLQSLLSSLRTMSGSV